MGLENIIAYLWCTKAIYNKTSREKSLVDVVVPFHSDRVVFAFICVCLSHSMWNSRKNSLCFFVPFWPRALAFLPNSGETKKKRNSITDMVGIAHRSLSTRVLDHTFLSAAHMKFMANWRMSRMVQRTIVLVHRKNKAKPVREWTEKRRDHEIFQQQSTMECSEEVDSSLLGNLYS